MSIKGTTDVYKYELIVKKKNNEITWTLYLNGAGLALASWDGEQEFTNDDISFKCRRLDGQIQFGVLSTPDKRHADCDWYDVSSLYNFTQDYWRFKSELTWGYCWLKMS